MMSDTLPTSVTAPPIRNGVLFWVCMTCERVATDGKCGPNHEIAAIPPPPFDARLN
jgi:hypothetical protein